MFEFCDSLPCVTLNKFDGNWTSKLLLSVHMSCRGNFWKQDNILDKFECHRAGADFSYSDLLYPSYFIKVLVHIKFHSKIHSERYYNGKTYCPLEKNNHPLEAIILKLNKEQRWTVIFIDYQESNYMYCALH